MGQGRPGERAAMILGVLTGKRMDQDKFSKLLEVSDSSTQLKLRVLHNAIIQCMRDYQTDRSRAKLNDWKAAEKTLEEFIDSLWKQHFQEDEEKPEEQPETLPNLLAVVDYLGKQGWSIKKSAVYKHQKEGKIRRGRMEGSGSRTSTPTRRNTFSGWMGVIRSWTAFRKRS
jgi:hypothetical protein